MEKKKIIQFSGFGKTKSPAENMQEKKRESCVVCGRQTAYFFDTPVSERAYYISGSGQLCPACFEEIYGKKTAPKE